VKRAVFACLVVAACGSGSGDRRTEVAHGTKRVLQAQIDAWMTAVTDLQAAAPTPAGRGWDPAADATAIAAMKEAWGRARVAYERIEGAIAPLFPDSDVATDARYDDFLTMLAPNGDPDPFDDKGVTGMHGIERVLYADKVPEAVVHFEANIPGYRPAAFPKTEADARSFKDKLAARLVRDVRDLRDQFRPLDPDIAFAFRGVIDLVKEQVEKVDKTASGEEESRYAQMTLRDLRSNREGNQAVYEVFRPWVLDQPDGAAHDQRVTAAFNRLETAYAAPGGDAMPPPPPTWSSIQPTAEDLATPFGRLFHAVKDESDETVAGSLHAELLAIATLLGLPEVP
jgi:iron uptake system component EfeO